MVEVVGFKRSSIPGIFGASRKWHRRQFRLCAGRIEDLSGDLDMTSDLGSHSPESTNRATPGDHDNSNDGPYVSEAEQRDWLASQMSRSFGVCRCLPVGSPAQLGWFRLIPHHEELSKKNKETAKELVRASDGITSSTQTTVEDNNHERQSCDFSVLSGSTHSLKRLRIKSKKNQEAQQPRGRVPIDAFTEISIAEEGTASSLSPDNFTGEHVHFHDEDGTMVKAPLYRATIAAPSVRSQQLEVGFLTFEERDMFLAAVSSCIAADRLRRRRQKPIVSAICESAYTLLSSSETKMLEYLFDITEGSTELTPPSVASDQLDSELHANRQAQNWRCAISLERLRKLRAEISSSYDALSIPDFPEPKQLTSATCSDNPRSLEKRRAKMDSFFFSLLDFQVVRLDPHLLYVLHSSRLDSEQASSQSDGVVEHEDLNAAAPTPTRDAPPQTAEATTDAVIVQGFGLPPGEPVLYRFSCALVRGIAIHGRLYLSQNYLCFYSNIFGIRHTEAIQLTDIVRVEPTGTLIPGIVIVYKFGGQERELILQGFCPSRDHALAKIRQMLERVRLGSLGVDVSTEIETEDLSPALLNATDVDTCDDFFQKWSAFSHESALQGENFTGVLDATLDAGLAKCFALLIRDPLFVEHYHMARGDRDIVVGPWQTVENLGLVRQVSYRAPLSNPIGPSSTGVTETHRIVSFAKEHLRMESVQVLADVPMADSFVVEMVWEYEEVDTHATRVKCSVGVHFSKRNWFKSKIQAQTRVETEQSLAKWLAQARTALSEQASLHDRPSTPRSKRATGPIRKIRRENSTLEEKGKRTEEQKSTALRPKADPDNIMRALMFLIFLALVANLLAKTM